MPDLITLAIPAFVALLFAEAIAGAIMRRDISEIPAGTTMMPQAPISATNRTFGDLHECR
jgi:hypothetical protein